MPEKKVRRKRNRAGYGERENERDLPVSFSSASDP